MGPVERTLKEMLIVALLFLYRGGHTGYVNGAADSVFTRNVGNRR